MKHKLQQFIFNSPRLSILLSLVLTCLLGFFITDLKINFSHKAWFSDDHSILKNLDEFERDFGNDESAIIAIQSDNIFTPKVLENIATLTNKLEFIKDIYSVDSIINYNQITSIENDINITPLIDEDTQWSPSYITKQKNVAKNDKDLQNYLLSPNLKTTLIIAKLRPFFQETAPYQRIKKDVEKLISTLPQSVDTKYHLLGKVALQSSMKEVAFKDTSTLLPALFILILIFLFFFFKSWQAIVFPILVTILTIFSTMGFAGLIGMEMVNISFIIPIILIAISIADSIHVVDVFFKDFKAKNSYAGQENSLKKSFEKNFDPTLLTSITTAIGFFSLSFSELIPISHFGLVSSIGCLLAWFYTFFLLIPCLKVIPIKKLNHFKVQRLKKESKNSIWKTYLTFLTSYRYSIFFGYIFITVLLIFKATHLRIDANPYQNFKENHPTRVSHQMMQENFGGSGGPEIIITSKSHQGAKDPIFLNRVDRFIEAIKKDQNITHISSAISIIKRVNRSLNADKDEFYSLPKTKEAIAQAILLYNVSVTSEQSIFQYISNDYSKLRLSLFWKYQNSVAGLEKAQEIKILAQKMNLNIKVTGKVNANQQMVNFVISTFINSILFSFLIVALILILYFKSPMMGFIGMIPNIAPLAFASGFLVLIDFPIDFTVAVVSSICLGIAVDDSIHFLASFLKYKKTMNTKTSLLKVFETTASSLILTTIILMIGFGVFVFSDFIPNRNFGLLSAAVLFIALLTDLLFLPVFFIIGSELKERRSSFKLTTKLKS